jgi:ABC-2 type transport system ATP-binding protein
MTETAQGPVVEVCGLRRSFAAVKAVEDVSFRFRGGEVHGFVGPNGAGKTTTMRIIATLDEADGGDVLIDGVSVTDYPDRARPRLGFMPDYLDSYREMNVRDYLDFYARAYRLPTPLRRQRLADVIGFTGLEGLLHRPVDELSKGMKQRLSLGRVLVNDPDVLILDEPASGLDPRARVEVRRLVRLLADRGKAVLISSHILTELAAICDAVTIIEQGAIRASDTMDRLHEEAAPGVRVEVRLAAGPPAEKERLLRILAEVPGVARAEPLMHGAAFWYAGEAGFRARVLARLVEEGFAVTDFQSARSDLEETFMALTRGEVS